MAIIIFNILIENIRIVKYIIFNKTRFYKTKLKEKAKYYNQIKM